MLGREAHRRGRESRAERPAAAPSPGGVAPHAAPGADVLAALGTTAHGLTSAEAEARLRAYGPNVLPSARPPSLPVLFLRQFLSPLIYVLLAAGAVSLAVGHVADAGFILAVLLLNAIIGTAQEHGAQRSAEALKELVAPRARVVRDGADRDLDAAALVPGDIVRLEGGMRVPADVRLLAAVGVQADESLLTGESLPVSKRAEPPVPESAPLADRACMLFAGTLVDRGRATGVVVATGAGAELGRIASAVVGATAPKAPLLVRMEAFSRRIALAVAVASAALGGVLLSRGTPAADVFLTAVALAVSAVPEGLPVALTVALAIGARRMGRRRVIVRRLVAVESLGSCTFIASDKTGTLTLNELTVRAVQLPAEEPWEVTGAGLDPGSGTVVVPGGVPRARERLERLCAAVALCNDAYLGRRDGEWTREGDAVDVALLVLAAKCGLSRASAEAECPRIGEIPFDPQARFAATLHAGAAGPEAFVKGAFERILPMCARMAGPGGDVTLDAARIAEQARALAAAGHRVIAVAGGPFPGPAADLRVERLRDLVLLGLVAMHDPLRPDAAASVAACREAGIEVAMVTGDHPVTALAIARELGLAHRADQVVTGDVLETAARDGTLGDVVARARVFARVDPGQKLDIVRAVQDAGHFVAVTGDGANDAPALRAAHIGVAMGARGTDVARESADIVLADDRFSSIVAGIEEGRVAYANVRKVIFLLVSTGAAEILLFVLAVAAGLPLPLLAVQLLWLNLVTNGIQDVALAFEPAEGDELRRPPRPPREPIFDRMMLARTALSAGVMGAIAFAGFAAALRAGLPLEEARNGLLLVMVLFENVQAGNARSERRSMFALSPFRNRLLLFGTLAALGVHIAAMHLPVISDVLGVAPATWREWGLAGAGALVLAVAVEIEKALRRRRGSGRPARRQLDR